MYPLKMQPVFKHYLWGGNRLATLFGKKSGEQITAECWEISCHPNGVSTVENGLFAGMPLDTLLALHPALCGNGPFPILIKLIDAKQKLSLQVHPSGEQSKNEMWYVLDAAPNAEIIAGFKPGVSREDFLAALQGGGLPELVGHFPVKAGDCISVPAGLIHGIGEGILLAEVQQSSDVTYRVYDYDRLDADGNPRPLHIAQAAEAIDFALEPVITSYKPSRDFTPLTDWPYFKSGIRCVSGHLSQLPQTSFTAMLVTSGNVTVTAGGETVTLAPGESALIPAATAYALDGRGEVLVTTV